MDEKDITYIKEHKRFRLDRLDYFGYAAFWFLILVLLSPCLIFGWGGVIACVPVCYFMFRILTQNRRFLCVTTPFAKAENYKAVLDIYQAQNKVIIRQYPEYIVCEIPGTAILGRSVITIVPLDNAILINSNGGRLTSIAIVANRKNIRDFIERLE